MLRGLGHWGLQGDCAAFRQARSCLVPDWQAEHMAQPCSLSLWQRQCLSHVCGSCLPSMNTAESLHFCLKF